MPVKCTKHIIIKHAASSHSSRVHQLNNTASITATKLWNFTANTQYQAQFAICYLQHNITLKFLTFARNSNHACFDNHQSDHYCERVQDHHHHQVLNARKSIFDLKFNYIANTVCTMAAALRGKAIAPTFLSWY
jgi:hypothetical protein